jgi:tRNA (guanine-N7-)-methyltransferase
LLVFDDFFLVLSMSTGILYTITDVQELGEWMKSTLDSHPLFEPLTADELEKDVCVELLSTATEEGQKVKIVI